MERFESIKENIIANNQSNRDLLQKQISNNSNYGVFNYQNKQNFDQ